MTSDLARALVTGLASLQSLVGSTDSRAGRLWIATRAAQRLGGESPEALLGGLAGSALWGLGRVLAEEQPDHWGGLIDLDPTASTEVTAQTLAHELRQGASAGSEVAYRGEPQTPVFAGLRLYQWAAIASVFAGILITTIKTTWPVLSPGLTWGSVAWAFFMWGFVQFLMGIDFPQSQKRFSRLA